MDQWGGKDLTVDDIRFPETADYTRDVLDKRDDYAEKYRSELGSNFLFDPPRPAGIASPSQRPLNRG